MSFGMELAFAALILACFHSFVSPDAQVDQLKDWNPNQVSPCTWFKVSCISNNVVSVSLTSMGFSGILSSKIEVLKTLQTLYV
ncbi:putative LRR receptor-like serine/threonine-protein kinase [Camellia lanceoleosa]|uniref:LRR receptor-like serine/threonine-protein kinase n=1 Tax=Camellia lanceoleosa TaxID=1840588 RepID=A0ACC0F2Z8_9ERIC|nr:putative LRR receptor-like serine/threonine-protein kinase [Camellia lanceoleosa]